MKKNIGKNQYIPPSWLNSNQNNNSSDSLAFQNDNVKIKSENINTIGQSGNSDVDVHVDVHVDTTAIAFAILTSLLATKQMTEEEFNIAVLRLENMTRGREQSIASFLPNNVSNVKLYTNNKKRVE